MTLDLTIEEINYILEAVGKKPFAECAPLINKIHMQAQPQLPKEEPKEEEVPAEVTIEAQAE